MSDSLVIESDAGTITVPGGTLVAVVTRAAEGIAGTRVRRRGATVDVAAGSARVRLDITMRYGTVVPDVGRDVQRVVADALSQMCGVSTSSVDLHVEELE